MGEYTITSSMSVFVWFVSLGIIAVNLFIVGGFLVDQGNSDEGASGWLYAAAGVGASFYLGFILFLLRQDLQKLKRRAGSLFMMLGGYDFVVSAHSRKQRVPSEDEGLCDYLETPDTAAVAVGNKPPLLGVGQDYAPVSLDSSLDREGDGGERAHGDGFGGGGGDGEIGLGGGGRRVEDERRRSVEDGDDARA